MSAAPRALNIFGAQGTGKGTQSKLLERHFGARHIGIGDILRKIAKRDTPEGRQVKQTIEAGKLVPNELATGIIREELAKLPADQTFVMEGYPRTIVQADDLQRLLEQQGRLDSRPAFIHLTVPEAELWKRLKKRQELEGRIDDTEASIQRRWREYEARTEPILDHVRSWADILEINGDQSVDQVTRDILQGLEHG